jgi:hypothetical protein
MRAAFYYLRVFPLALHLRLALTSASPHLCFASLRLARLRLAGKAEPGAKRNKIE